MRMGSVDLVIVCSLSFLSVFIVLAVLALVMHLITRLLPVKNIESDAALYAAMTASAAQIYPNRKITKIEELK